MEGVEVEDSPLLPKQGEVRGEVREVLQEGGGHGGEEGGSQRRHKHFLTQLKVVLV